MKVLFIDLFNLDFEEFFGEGKLQILT